MRGEVGQTLPAHEVMAKNYGAEHANKIHSDEGAARYGFAGALVPGVGLYAYLTRPVIDALGHDWLERGAMTAQFVKPVYDGERVVVRGTVVGREPITLQLELRNAAGTLCASATASLPDMLPALDARDYPQHPLPRTDQLRPATIMSFTVGEPLGTLAFKLDLADEMTRFLDNVVETSPLYRRAGAATLSHPAFLIAQANEVLMRNIALGPWIHTGSNVQHYALAEEGEVISVRGRVRKLYEKRGHEFIVADLGMFGVNERPIAHLEHTAIIRLREVIPDQHR